MEGLCDDVMKIVTGWCIWWLYCLQCYGISQQYCDQYKHFPDHWTQNNSQDGKKHDCNLAINVFLRLEKEAPHSLPQYIPSLCPMSAVPRPAASQYLDWVNSITFSDLSWAITSKISVSSNILHKLCCLSSKCVLLQNGLKRCELSQWVFSKSTARHLEDIIARNFSN